MSGTNRKLLQTSPSLELEGTEDNRVSSPPFPDLYWKAAQDDNDTQAPGQKFPFGLTRPRWRLTVATTARHSKSILSPNGDLGLCILMLRQRFLGLLLPKKGELLKGFLAPLPGLLILPKREDFGKIPKRFLLPLVPAKEKV